jgi:hypothetical protein
LLALLVAAASVAAAPALAAGLRVEGPSHTVFQGRAKPFVGILKGHTTTKPTALGTLVTAARRTPFQLALTWFDGQGGAWQGFFVSSIDHTPNSGTGYWAWKLGHVLSNHGLGGVTVTRRSQVLVYWTTFDPDTGATEPTLGITASDRTPAPGTNVTITVAQYDDAGNATPAAGAWVWVNGAATRADAGGTVTLRVAKGAFRIHATESGTIRSRVLWVRAS